MKFKIISKEQQAQILTVNHSKLEWGYHFPSSATGAIGARLIQENGKLTIIRDRVSFARKDSAADTDVSRMVQDKQVITGLNQFLNENFITGRSEDIVYGKYQEYHLLATPRASHGYVYISIWK